MWTRLFGVAGNCFLETIRQPIYGIILLVTAGLLVFNVAISGFTLDDDNKLLADLGLSTLLMSGLFLAAFSAAGVLSREIDNKTVLTVISKPVGRPVFLLGKFVGLGGALALATYLSSCVFLLTVRHRVMERSSQHLDMPVIIFGVSALAAAILLAGLCNYLYGMQFASTAIGFVVPLMTVAVFLVCLISPKWHIQTFGKDFLDGQIIAAVVLVFFAVMILTAVAIAASTRLGQVMTLAVCTGVLLIGLISDYLFGTRADESLLAQVGYWLAPNIGFLWVTDAITQGHTMGLQYVGTASLYAVLYVGAALCLAIALFQRREVG
jgi:ABC-2 type transport system permease protein